MKNFLFASLFIIGSFSASAQVQKEADTTLKGFPVLRSYVAPDVVERAKKKYGRALYCIEQSTAANCQNSYLVGLIKNGHLNMEWMCDDPKIAFRPNTTQALTAVLQKSKAKFSFALYSGGQVQAFD